MKNYFKFLFSLFLILWISTSVGFAQVRNATPLESLIFDDTELKLTRGIRDMNERKAAVAYNISNVTTPGFKPMRFQDEIEEALRLYGDPRILEEVNIDDEMVKATRIRLNHQAYIRLLTTKMSITKRIVTLGKGG